MNSTTCCTRCGRTLTAEESIKKGYGPVCGKKIRAALRELPVFKPEQIAKAEELIEDGGIVAVRETVFRTVSTDGTETYLSHPTNCTCAAGRNGRTCYHQIAAGIMLAA